jgi:bacterioferritin
MKPNNQPFLSDIQEIRRRAREHMERGSVTEGYELDVTTAVRLLNEALATEIVCNLRYMYHYHTADGIHAQAVKEEFLEHANEERDHADWIATRIRQLGGNPEMNPEGLMTRSHAEYREGTTLLDKIRENLVAERIAIESYRDMIRFFSDKDPTSRRLMERILETEEEHAEDMASFLQSMDQTRESAA